MTFQQKNPRKQSSYKVHKIVIKKGGERQKSRNIEDFIIFTIHFT